jgi:hypothetical protein
MPADVVIPKKLVQERRLLERFGFLSIRQRKQEISFGSRCDLFGELFCAG